MLNVFLLVYDGFRAICREFPGNSGCEVLQCARLCANAPADSERNLEGRLRSDLAAGRRRRASSLGGHTENQLTALSMFVQAQLPQKTTEYLRRAQGSIREHETHTQKSQESTREIHGKKLHVAVKEFGNLFDVLKHY